MEGLKLESLKLGSSDGGDVGADAQRKREPASERAGEEEVDEESEEESWDSEEDSELETSDEEDYEDSDEEEEDEEVTGAEDELRGARDAVLVLEKEAESQLAHMKILSGTILELQDALQASTKEVGALRAKLAAPPSAPVPAPPSPTVVRQRNVAERAPSHLYDASSVEDEEAGTGAASPGQAGQSWRPLAAATAAAFLAGYLLAHI